MEWPTEEEYVNELIETGVVRVTQSRERGRIVYTVRGPEGAAWAVACFLNGYDGPAEFPTEGTVT